MCPECKYYYELKKAKPVDIKNNIYIHGYCYKPPYGLKNGFPVYLPEGYCKDIKPKKRRSVRENQVDATQITFDDYLQSFK